MNRTRLVELAGVIERIAPESFSAQWHAGTSPRFAVLGRQPFAKWRAWDRDAALSAPQGIAAITVRRWTSFRWICASVLLDEVADLLYLTDQQACQLLLPDQRSRHCICRFCPCNVKPSFVEMPRFSKRGDPSWKAITPQVAADCIRHLVATGEVNWHRAYALHHCAFEGGFFENQTPHH